MNQDATILTIEDDAAIRQGMVDALAFSGFRIIEASNGQEGLQHAVASDYDLLLLDLALPHVSGWDILRKVREVRPTQPIIILTAKGEEADRVLGLKNGADDYVVKPFSIKELIARVEAVLRRSPGRPAVIQKVLFYQGMIDFGRREISFNDQTRAELSEKEIELLEYLVANRQRAVSREELLANVWRLSPQGISTRTIDMHIARLREKLRDSTAELLITVRGKGYMWAAMESGSTM